MNRRLMLMRHAESLQHLDGIDFERPLSEYGRKQAAEIGSFLLATKWIPDFILVSSAKRTLQTASLLAKTAKIKTETIFVVDDLYNASPRNIVRAINNAQISDDVCSLLVIAHNPGVSQFAVACSGASKTFYFAPAAIAGFEIENSQNWGQFTADNARFSFFHELLQK